MLCAGCCVALWSITVLSYSIDEEINPGELGGLLQVSARRQAGIKPPLLTAVLN